MSAKHTPGPWFARSPVDPRYMMAGPAIAAHGIVVGQVNAAWPEYVANARLIAAAPELLDAAKLAVTEFATDGQVFRDAIGVLKAAIANAEGRGA